MVENYKPIYLPTMINIKLTDKEREMLATTYCGMQWLLENVDAGMGTAVAEGYEYLDCVQRSVLYWKTIKIEKNNYFYAKSNE